MFTSQQKRLVQSTFLKLSLVSNQAGEWFYNRLFELDPDIKPLFANTNIHVQSTKLLQMIATVVTSLDRLEQLTPTLKDLGQRHITYGVKREHYAIVGQALMSALAHVLGAEFTPEAEDAWNHVYNVMVSITIEGIYDASQPVNG